MNKKYKDYRPNVAAVLLSSDYPEKKLFFLGKRRNIKRAWQFPQGGIDKGETPREALLRELREEIGTDEVEIIAEFPEWICYDFPNKQGDKIYPYKGQKQQYFLVILKKGAKIYLNNENPPEFEDYVFVTEEELFKKATYLKRKAYRRVIKYFKEKGYL